MRSEHRTHAANARRVEIAPECDDREIRELWRELARPVTFFDLCSPSIFFGSKIGEFFRIWRARQGSNLQPPDSKSGAQYHCEWFRMLIVLLLAPIRSASAAKSVL